MIESLVFLSHSLLNPQSVSLRNNGSERDLPLASPLALPWLFVEAFGFASVVSSVVFFLFIYVLTALGSPPCPGFRWQIVAHA